MGCFSWNCRCGHSVMNPYVTEKAWLNDAVLLLSDGSVIKGHYDGYGRIETSDGGVFEVPWEDSGFEIYHVKCWEAAGKPSYERSSPSAMGQGHFFDDFDEGGSDVQESH